MNLTRLEASFLVLIISEYMRLAPEGYLEVQKDVTSGDEIYLKDLLARLIVKATVDKVEYQGNFNVRNTAIEQKLRSIGKYIGDDLPTDWGFALFLFSYGENGNMFYISSAQRSDIIKTLKEFIARNTQ
jgi:hypothetical protein